jgi:hypothetical protein
MRRSVRVRLPQFQSARDDFLVHLSRHEDGVVQLAQKMNESRFAQGDERAGTGNCPHASSSSTICSDQRGRMPEA